MNYTDSYPSQLRGTVGTTVEEDVRVEFQQTRRAHITIEWKTPESKIYRLNLHNPIINYFKVQLRIRWPHYSETPI